MRYFTINQGDIRCEVEAVKSEEKDHRRPCRLPTCRRPVARATSSGETRGRKKQFCSRSCSEKFTRTRQHLDEAIDELIEELDSGNWTTREKRSWASMLRRLLDLRSMYITPAEYLAVTLDDVDHIGEYGRRPTASVIRGWLRRPRPHPDVACRRCSGTGEDERVRRLGRKGRGSHAHAHAQDLRDVVHETLWEVARRSPEQQLNEWYRLAYDWAESEPGSIKHF